MEDTYFNWKSVMMTSKDLSPYFLPIICIYEKGKLYKDVSILKNSVL